MSQSPSLDKKVYLFTDTPLIYPKNQWGLFLFSKTAVAEVDPIVFGLWLSCTLESNAAYLIRIWLLIKLLCNFIIVLMIDSDDYY